VEVRLDSVEIKVDHLGEKFEGMEVKFDALAEGLSQKADKKDVIALAHRVTKLEAN
jgi:hypothetical protein